MLHFVPLQSQLSLQEVVNSYDVIASQIMSFVAADLGKQTPSLHFVN